MYWFLVLIPVMIRLNSKKLFIYKFLKLLLILKRISLHDQRWREWVESSNSKLSFADRKSRFETICATFAAATPPSSFHRRWPGLGTRFWDRESRKKLRFVCRTRVRNRVPRMSIRPRDTAKFGEMRTGGKTFDGLSRK